MKLAHLGRATALRDASPGLKAGRGLKLVVVQPCDCLVGGFARPQGRARIETRMQPLIPSKSPASPGLKAGRGLKLLVALLMRDSMDASPGLKAGRGLKHLSVAAGQDAAAGFARPQGRARIETPRPASAFGRCSRFARPQGRARIETSPALQMLPLPSQRFARPQGRARIETWWTPYWCRASLQLRPASRPGAD